MSRKERTTKATFKTIVCFVAAFVISFNMIAVNGFTVRAEDDQNDNTEDTTVSTVLVTEEAPIVVAIKNTSSTEETVVVPQIEVMPPSPVEGSSQGASTTTDTTNTTTDTTNTTTDTTTTQQTQQTQENTQPTISNDNVSATTNTKITEDAAKTADKYTAVEDTYTYGSDNKTVVSYLFYHDSDTEITDLEASDFVLDNIDKEKYDVVYDPETGILAVAEKSSIVHDKGSVEVQGSPKTSVYYEFAEVTTNPTVNDLPVGTKLYFLPHEFNDKLKSTDSLLGLPTGTATLETMTPTTSTSSYAYKDINTATGSELTNYKMNVKPIKKSKEFDHCNTGAFYYFAPGTITNSTYKEREGYTSYWCQGRTVRFGGTEAYGRVYTYKETEVTIDGDTFIVDAKENGDLPLGEAVLKDSDLGKYVDLKIKYDVVENGQTVSKVLSVAGCSVSDGEVNYLEHDSSIQLEIGGKVVTVNLDTTGMEEKVWKNDNQEIINATKVTAEDLADIKQALSEGMVNIDIDGTETEYVELKNKLHASVWQINNKEAIEASETDYDKYKLVTETSNRYVTKVSDKVKAYMEVDLLAKQLAMTNNIDNDANTFVTNYIQDSDTSEVFTDATAENTDQIIASEDIYNDLHSVVKDFVDKKISNSVETTAEETVTYGALVKKAKNIKAVATDFVNTFAAILADEEATEKTNIEVTDLSNYELILLGEEAWDNMTTAERNYANKILKKTVANEETGETYVVSFDKLLADAKEIRNSLVKEEPKSAPAPVVSSDKNNNSRVNAYVAPRTNDKTTEEAPVMAVAKKAPEVKAIEVVEEKEEIAVVETKMTSEVEEDIDSRKIREIYAAEAEEVEASEDGIKTQGFGLGSILINVQTFLENTEDGMGTYMQSRGKDKNELQNYENQLSYTLANAEEVAGYILTDEELQYVKNGDTMEIRLRITPNEKTLSIDSYREFAEAVEKEKKNIEGLTKGEYIDISLEKRHNSEDWKYVPNTNGEIRIDMDVPEEFLKSGRQYYVMRNHNGEVTLLHDLDDNENTITIETDCFSDYLILYDDTYAVSDVEVETEVIEKVVERPVIAAVTVDPIDNINGAAAVVCMMFLLLIFAVVIYNARRETEE